MVISFKTETITVIRPTYITERGNQIPDWDNTTEHSVTGCRVQPMAGEEVLFSGAGEGGQARDAVVSRWKIFGPDGAAMDLDEQDRVRHAGIVYEVDGYIQRWPSPTGVLRHDEAVLRRVDG